MLQAIPRVTSQGCVCGAVYRVASERNFNPGVSVLEHTRLPCMLSLQLQNWCLHGIGCPER